MSNEAKCRGCGKDIIWIEMAGKKIPIDKRQTLFYVPEYDGQDTYKTVSGHINHFVTCPQREQFKKPKEFK